MTTTYLGTLTLGELTPGLGGRISKLLTALSALRLALGPVKLALQAQADAAAALSLGISAAVLADIDFQLAAALSFEANLGIAIEDPATYLAGLLQASLSVSAVLNAPDINIGAQLAVDVAASASVAASLTAQRIAIQLLIDAAAQVKVQLLALLDVLGLSIDASLALEAQITLGGVLQAQLSSGGIALYRYDGAVDAMGAELSAQLAGGLPGWGIPTQSVMTLVLVAGTPSAQGTLEFAFKTSLRAAVQVVPRLSCLRERASLLRWHGSRAAYVLGSDATAVGSRGAQLARVDRAACGALVIDQHARDRRRRDASPAIEAVLRPVAMVAACALCRARLAREACRLRRLSGALIRCTCGSRCPADACGSRCPRCASCAAGTRRCTTALGPSGASASADPARSTATCHTSGPASSGSTDSTGCSGSSGARRATVANRGSTR